ncbi:NAD(P)H-binding protein [Croceibacterium sp. LX-88]|uniref:NAD(P)H-binding protein n=1 Tax=Croceibacterium selenioxidans TaxID=2838833 RepID=A0ABS5W3C3_9SPHN|nr:NAD(P)H-binding protein [Croceibacterium selenioxidans]MBT2134261.1 NAD(P)H-binding protein [Croceibacterium selenioxidans]
MSEPYRVLLVGASGLVGHRVMETAKDEAWLRVVALARRETPMPRGAKMEMLVAPPGEWPEVVAAIAPDAMICALGTTMKQAGSEEAFRSVDHDLVLSVASAAREAGVKNFVLISSVGANPNSKTFYLRVKGEVEAAVSKLRFRRLDILRPGLLRGKRQGEARRLERMAMLFAPLTDLFMLGGMSRYRSIEAREVAAAAIQCSREKASGQFVHEHAAILRQARRLS